MREKNSRASSISLDMKIARAEYVRVECTDGRRGQATGKTLGNRKYNVLYKCSLGG